MTRVKVLVFPALFSSMFLIGCSGQQSTAATTQPSIQASVASVSAQPLTNFSQRITASNLPHQMKVGEAVVLPITITNTGTQMWPADGTDSPKLVDFSYRWFDNKGKFVSNTSVTILHNLVPGESLATKVEIKAPEQAGNYVLRLGMVQETIAWFDDKGGKSLNAPVTIIAN